MAIMDDSKGILFPELNWHEEKAEFHRKQMEQAKADNKPKAEAAHKFSMENYLTMSKDLYK